MEDTNHTLTEIETAEAEAAANTYTLTADERAQIEALQREMRSLQEDAAAVVRSIARVRGLNGNWSFNAATNTFTKGRP